MTITAADPTDVEFGRVQPIVVHFDDLDAMGIVHNARYSVLVERALSLYWGGRGYSFVDGAPTSPDIIHAVREFTITYHRPIRGTGEVAVHFWLNHLGGTSAEYGFRFLSADGTLHADGRRAIVRLDPETMRPAPWTDTFRAVAAPLLRPAPTTA